MRALKAIRNFALLCGSLVAVSALAGDRPNVVVILIDDMGYADLGFIGCTEIPTPK